MSDFAPGGRKGEGMTPEAKKEKATIYIVPKTFYYPPFECRQYCYYCQRVTRQRVVGGIATCQEHGPAAGTGGKP